MVGLGRDGLLDEMNGFSKSFVWLGQSIMLFFHALARLPTYPTNTCQVINIQKEGMSGPTILHTWNRVTA